MGFDSSFPFNWYPQRVGIRSLIVLPPFHRTAVSIQLVSPASGDKDRAMNYEMLTGVSIQLVSPASGDVTLPHLCSLQGIVCFHSIGIPSEWGSRSKVNPKGKAPKVSIQLVSPASGDINSSNCFTNHKNQFPFNWYPQRVGITQFGVTFDDWHCTQVSIQLVSPASGDSRKSNSIQAPG